MRSGRQRQAFFRSALEKKSESEFCIAEEKEVNEKMEGMLGTRSGRSEKRERGKKERETAWKNESMESGINER